MSVAKRKSSRRPAPRQDSGARRLGTDNTRPAASAGAQRRQSRARQRRPNYTGYIAIAAVVVIVGVFLAVRLSSSPAKPSSSGSNGVTTGQHPAVAPLATMVDPVVTIPLAVFNSVGIDGQPSPLVVTKDQPSLVLDGLPRFVYQGAEYCPYCAMVRWSLVASLARFGSFTDLKQTSSANDDGDIPTFSFLGSTYTSKYLKFSPYEGLDRDQQPLQTIPSDMQALYTKYDGNQTTLAPAAPFNLGTQTGIPFLDFANKYVSSGAPSFLDPVLSALTGGGPGPAAVASALHDPTSSVGQAISAKLLVALANYFSAAICNIDGNQPSSVCTSSGVHAAKTVFAAQTPVS